jgi:uncharacterized protein
MTKHVRGTARTQRRWFAAWAGVVLIASLANVAAWVWHVGGVVRVLSNIAWLFGLPGWVPIYALGFRSIRDHPGWILGANAIAWAAWFAVVLVGAAIRNRTRARGDRHVPVPDPSRRKFLAHTGIGMLSGGFIGAPVYGAAVEPSMLRTRRYTVPIRGLPSDFDGLRLVQFADPHLGPRIPASYVASAVRHAIGLAPDVVVLNGDYVADGTQEIERIADLLAPLVRSATVGAVGVLGNHDWWADASKVRDAMRRVGVRMIDNDRVWIDPLTRLLSEFPPVGGLALVGLGDLDEDETDMDGAFRGVDAPTPRIVVAHQPDSAELSGWSVPDAPRADLMLSGHTHGGQVRIPLVGTPMVPSRYGQKYAGGLVQGPHFPVIVSRGVGMSLLPVRIGVPPEVSLITLKRE